MGGWCKHAGHGLYCEGDLSLQKSLSSDPEDKKQNEQSDAEAVPTDVKSESSSQQLERGVEHGLTRVAMAVPVRYRQHTVATFISLVGKVAYLRFDAFSFKSSHRAFLLLFLHVQLARWTRAVSHKHVMSGRS